MGTKVSLLPAAGTLDGTEMIPIVQGGATKRVLLSSVAAFLGATSPSPTPSISLQDVTQNEGNSGTTLFNHLGSVTRNGVTGALTVNWTVTANSASINPAAATDFVGDAFPSGTLGVTSGASAFTVPVPVKGETNVESNDSYIVTVTLVGYTNVTASAIGTIVNDDSSSGGGTLGPTSAYTASSGAPGAPIATITGLGSGETISSVSPNDGRIAVASGGTKIVKGLTASSAGSAVNYTLTTSTGRTLVMAVNTPAAMTSASKINWLVAGDSIGRGGNNGGVDSGPSPSTRAFVGYPYAVVNDNFAAPGTDTYSLLHQGTGGASPNGYMGNGAAAYYDPSRPNVAFIQRGVNGLVNHTNDEYIQYDKDLVALLRSQGFYVVRGTILPKANSDGSAPSDNAQRVDLNSRIRANEAGYDAVIDFDTNADMSHVSDAADLTKYGDRLHPTASGAQSLSVTIFAVASGFGNMPPLAATATPPAGLRQPLNIAFNPNVDASSINAAAPVYTTGKFGQGVTSNGTRLAVPMASFNTGTNKAFAIEFFISIPSGATIPDGSQPIRLGLQNGKPGLSLWITANTITLYGRQRDGSYQQGPGSAVSLSTTPVHVIIFDRNDGNGPGIIVNGVPVFGTSVIPYDEEGFPLFVQPGNPGTSTGSVIIDDLKIYSALRSDYATVPTAPGAGSEANLLAYYKLDGDLTDAKAA